MAEPSLEELLTSWLRQLRAERKSQATLNAYRCAVGGYLRWCAETCPDLGGFSADAVIGYLGAHPGETSTLRLHLTCLKLFAKWLAAEGEDVDATAICALRMPRQDVKTVPVLTDAEIAALLAACAGTTWRDKRDKAILLLALDTGLRAAELCACDVDDLDLDACLVLVRRGKGGRARRVKFSPTTAAAIDRWLRARRDLVRPPAAAGPLWIGRYGVRLGYTSMADALKKRAELAGVKGFHMHRTRHTAATRWLSGGGSEVGLMHQAGWTSRTMIDRYTRASSERLANEEFDRLHLGVVDL
jgi:integrase